MLSYSEKRKLARQQIAQKQFPEMRDVEGRVWLGERYHVMYSDWFSAYLLYKLTGEVDELESYDGAYPGDGGYTGFTWWGFWLGTMDEERGICIEQPLPATEVKEWLALNYSNLETLDDYEYLVNVLYDFRAKYRFANNHNVIQALEWSNEQLIRAKAFSILPNRHAPALPVPVDNPWERLLIGGLTIDSFYQYLEACGLLTADGQITPLGLLDNAHKARQAPWVGSLRALLDNHLLDSNVAAICRALADPSGKLGVVMSENILRDPSRKAKDYYQPICTQALRKLELLRN